MAAEVHEPHDFIAYPTNRVVATIENVRDARAAIEDLLNAGIDEAAIDILHGERDVHRLDPTGAEHGFLARFQRTLLRAGAGVEEYEHLRRHAAEVRAGHYVIMVHAPDPFVRERVAAIFNAHRAQSVEFFGRWAWRSMDAVHIERTPVTEEPIAGRTIETTLEDRIVQLQFVADDRARVTMPGGAAAEAAVTRVRPRLWLVSWRDNGRAITQVLDLQSGAAHASISDEADGIRHTSGTLTARYD